MLDLFWHSYSVRNYARKSSLYFTALFLFFYYFFRRVSLEDRGRLGLRLSAKWRRTRRRSRRLLLLLPSLSLTTIQQFYFSVFFYFRRDIMEHCAGNAWRKTNQKWKREHEKCANMAVGNIKKSE